MRFRMAPEVFLLLVGWLGVRAFCSFAPSLFPSIDAVVRARAGSLSFPFASVAR